MAMNIDIPRYCKKLLQDYQAWAETRLKMHFPQMATVSLSETSPENFLLHKYNPNGSSDGKTETLSLSDALNDLRKPFAFLLADPGMGKTSIFWLLCKNGAEAILSNPESKTPLPLKLSLSSYAINSERGESLEIQLFKVFAPFVDNSPAPPEAWQQILDSRPLRILLDGYNEVASKYSATLLKEISALSIRLARSSQSHFLVVSSRSNEAHQSISGFTCVEISPLNQDQIKLYLKSYFPQDHESIFQQIEKHHLIPIMQVPLFLFFLSTLYKGPASEDIFSNKGRLLKKIIDDQFLMGHETHIDDARRPPLNARQCSKILEYLSFNSLESESGLGIGIAEIEAAYKELCNTDSTPLSSIFDFEPIIESLCSHGLLEKEAGTTFHYWHPIFRDYFAAVRFSSTYNSYPLKHDRITFLRQKARYTRWDEALKIFFGLCENKVSKESLISLSSFGIPSTLFCAKLVADNSSFNILPENQFLIDRLFSRLTNLQNHFSLTIRAQALLSLENMDDIKACYALTKALKDDNEFLKAVAIRDIGDRKYLQAVDDLLPFLDIETRLIQPFAVDALAKIGSPKSIAPIARLVKSLEEYAILPNVKEDPKIVQLRNFAKTIADNSINGTLKIDSPGIERLFLAILRTEYYSRIGNKAFANVGLPNTNPEEYTRANKEHERMEKVKGYNSTSLPDDINVLSDALRDRSSWVRKTALKTFEKIGRPEFKDIFWGLLISGSEDDEIKWLSAVALANLKWPSKHQFESFFRLLIKLTGWSHGKTYQNAALMVLYAIEVNREKRWVKKEKWWDLVVPAPLMRFFRRIFAYIENLLVKASAWTAVLFGVLLLLVILFLVLSSLGKPDLILKMADWFRVFVLRITGLGPSSTS